jgi:hypothetical protein
VNRQVVRITGGLDSVALREFRRLRIAREAAAMAVAADDEMGRIDPRAPVHFPLSELVGECVNPPAEVARRDAAVKVEVLAENPAQSPPPLPKLKSPCPNLASDIKPEYRDRYMAERQPYTPGLYIWDGFLWCGRKRGPGTPRSAGPPLSSF